MSKRKAGFPSSGMPAEEAEETSTLFFSILSLCRPHRSTGRLAFLSVGASVYGSSVGCSTRETQLSLCPLLQESKRPLGSVYVSAAQLTGTGRTCLECMSLEATADRRSALSCAMTCLVARLD